MVCLVAVDSVFVTWIDFFKRTIAAIFVTLSFGCCVYAGSYAENHLPHRAENGAAV